MKIESYKRVKDLVAGDKLLTSDNGFVVVKELHKEKGRRNSVLILFEDGQASSALMNDFVLMPNTTQVYLLQPTIT